MSRYIDRIEALDDRARRDHAAFQAPADPLVEEQARRYLREGVGEVIAVYVDARTVDGERFGPSEFDQLERAMNTWFELYARCYGCDLDAAFSVREAAEALVDTHNIYDVARVLTHVPVRDSAGD